jgi:DNA-binding NtrC family response regulator
MPTILAVDDDPMVVELIKEALKSTGEVISANTGAQALERVKKNAPDVLVLDIQLPDASGLEMVEQVRALDAKLPIVFVTVSKSSEVAIEAIQKGAFDFLTKPLEMQLVQEVVQRALQTRMMQMPVAVDHAEDDAALDMQRDVMIGKSPQMMEVYKEIGRVAAKKVTVLICGESGTGKELVARAIYQHSDRRDQPFLAVNCAALAETLLESELFGHEKGAFTGADQQRIGKFEQCNGGTIFLDEVGDMSSVLQAKVLRVLQEQKFERVGGRTTIHTDVHIISATNRDLEKMIQQDNFRLDLYHRLNNFRIDLPPLRERSGDIPILARYFFRRLKHELKTDKQGIAPEAMRLLEQYSWPGNIRQLQSLLRRAILRSTSPVLVPSDFPDEMIGVRKSDSGKTGTKSDQDDSVESNLSAFIDLRRKQGTNQLYNETLEYMERYLLSLVLREHQGNQSKAATELGISRGRLRNKIRALGISIEKTVEI